MGFCFLKRKPQNLNRFKQAAIMGFFSDSSGDDDDDENDDCVAVAERKEIKRHSDKQGNDVRIGGDESQSDSQSSANTRSNCNSKEASCETTK